MYYKCELLVDGNAYAVTDRIRNWEDVSMSFKRNDYDGVVRTFTDKFEFILGTRELLLNEYRKNYLKASAVVIVYTRTNSWEWAERFRCALNFSTLSDDGHVLSMNAIDDSVASLIKAKRGTQYEYVVEEVKDGVPLYYDRMSMQGKGEWCFAGNGETKGGVNVYANKFTANGDTTIPLYMVGDPEIPVKNSVEMKDVEMLELSTDIVSYLSSDAAFFRVVKPIELGSLDGFVAVKCKSNIKLNATLNGKGSCKVLLTHGTWLGVSTSVWSKTIVNGINDLSFDIEQYTTGILDRNFFLIVQLSDGAECELWQSEADSSNQRITIEYTDRGSYYNLDVIKPVTLLNRLLKSMNGGKEGLTGVIEPSGEKRLDNAMILAAESVRKLSGAKIYSSFAKFCEWMKSVFGYVYDINGNVVTFRPRRDYFGEEVVKTIGNYNGYGMSVNSSMIYSQVNIGYEKQDYDSVNGKDEFRFTNIYNTGITITDNKLELISPYRADAYGIEFLAQTIGEDTTDDSSDTDVFFVCVKESGGRYELDRDDRISGVISPLTMFNVMYSPTSMIEANKDFLGGLVSELEYASSEGNTSVVINGEVENRNVALDGGLFVVDEVEVETSDIDLPEDMTGVVELHHQGEVVRGYYKSADFHYTKTKSAKITLIIKK